ncbi:MAG TPA: aminopeptidase P N-terminal domain-containing protein [Candidatus Saccharimonadales bacterium]|nr:aminopeptidase P N-terminal domain-containing protein [Candidatus Saccharimonadales bacterium]
MESHFTSEFFAGNRARLKGLFTGTAPIVITANGLLQRGADGAYGFAQDASFWYLTGIDEPDVLLVMDRDKEYLIAPELSDYQKAFDGAESHALLARRAGIAKIYDGKEGWQQLAGRIKKVKHVATLAPPPARLEQYGLYVNPARASLVAKLKSYNAELQLLDLAPHLSRLRMIKQPAELRAIQAAIDITAASLKDAFRPSKLKKYATEYQLEAEIAYGFRKRGAAGHAFAPIVAGGKRACTLHNVANNAPLRADELVVADVGAEVEHYAADITRTISLSAASRRQQTVYKAVLEAQDYAMGLLKPGVRLREYEHQVELFLGEKLRELGLIKTIDHQKVRHYCPHATSHFLGLNVHDVGDYDRPLEAGTVLTVEPGIYIPEEAIGVRIEDDVLITDTGVKNLSRRLPRELG